MEELSTFFEKFKKLTLPYKEVRDTCASYCSQVLKRPITASQIDVRAHVVYIKLPPLEKGEILMRKTELLSKLNSTLKEGQAPFKDIR